MPLSQPRGQQRVLQRSDGAHERFRVTGNELYQCFFGPYMQWSLISGCSLGGFTLNGTVVSGGRDTGHLLQRSSFFFVFSDELNLQPSRWGGDSRARTNRQLKAVGVLFSPREVNTRGSMV
jgi:hypothetical protein